MRPVVQPGFVVADGSPPSLDELLAAIASALRSTYTLDRERATRRTRRIWLDTFDWRLFRAGVTLTFSAGELVLTGDDGHPPIVQHTPGWRPPSRGPVTLPSGPVTARIAPLIAPRALLKVAEVSTSAVSLALRNADAKTVARLIVDWPDTPAPDTSAPGAPTPTAPAPAAPAPGAPILGAPTPAAGAGVRPRIAITEIRGYAVQARRVATLLQQALPDLRAPVTSVLEEAAPRRPGAYTGKVDAPIFAQQPAPLAVAIVLLNLLDTLEANVDGVLRDIDTEFLHDLRVAVRRTRSALKLPDSQLPVAEIQHFRDEFKWLGDVTTPVRDLDVHLLGFADTAAALHASTPTDLEPVHEYLARRRATEFRKLRQQLKSDRFATLVSGWRKELLAVIDHRPRRSWPDARAFAVATTRSAWRKVLRKGAAITAESPPEALHDLRKRAKELRYALEFYAPVFPEQEYAPAISGLKKLQDCLGEYQDTQVQIDEIRQHAAGLLADRAHPVRADTLLAMGEVIAGLAARQRAAREEFARRFAAFAGTAGNRRFDRLLGDDQ